MYVNNTLVCDGWTTPGSAATTPVAGTITLTGGVRYLFHVDFANTNSTTSAFLNLMYQPPTAGALSTVPNTVFFRDATTAQQGLLATYYTNTTEAAPYFYQVQENNNPGVDLPSGTGQIICR